jgi:DNA-binding CsgD family transcriptional regulator
MMVVNRIEHWDHSSQFFHELAPLVSGIGRDSFADAVFGLFNPVIRIDHVSLFRLVGGREIDVLATASAPCHPVSPEAGERYLHRFAHLDPARAFPSPSSRDNTGLLLQFSAKDIHDPGYRRDCYEAVGLEQRISLSVRYQHFGYQVNLYRLRGGAPFATSAHARQLMQFCSLVIPVFARHAELLTSAPQLGGTHLSLERIRERIAALGEKLSHREIEVCARALYGQSIDATAAALRIARTSVITYRQRAYAKLGISCHSQLFTRLVA